MTDAYDTILWRGRFERYTDADLLDWWARADEEPSGVDEICLAQIEKRGLDF